MLASISDKSGHNSRLVSNVTTIESKPVELGSGFKKQSIDHGSESTRLGSLIEISADGSVLAVGEGGPDTYEPTHWSQRISQNVVLYKRRSNEINGEVSWERLPGYTQSPKDFALSSDGSRLATSSPFSWDGHIYVYGINENGSLRSLRTFKGHEDFDYFGSSLSLSDNGQKIAVGGEGNIESDDTYGVPGRATVYDLKTGKIELHNKGNNDIDLNHKVALSSDSKFLVIGRPNRNVGGNTNNRSGVFSTRERLVRLKFESAHLGGPVVKCLRGCRGLVHFLPFQKTGQRLLQHQLAS